MICPSPRGYDDPELDDVAMAQGRWRPRPSARRTFLVTTGDYELSRMSRFGLTVAAVVAEEAEDMAAGLAGDRRAGIEPEAEDRAIWESGRLVAFVRASAAGELEVIILEPAEGGDA